MPSHQRNAALDGVRAVAIGVVLLFHGRSGWFVGGHVGVDVFFVLSGFLITRSLMGNTASPDRRLDLLGFWRRRAFRLLPAAVVCIVVTSAVMAMVSAPSQRPALQGDAVAGLLYVANWRFLAQNNAYFREGLDLSPYLHLWSLSVEEQFYIAFPFVLLLALWIARRRLRRSLAAVMTMVLGLAVGWAVWLALTAEPDRVFYGTDAHAYQLLAGAALSLWMLRRGDPVDSRGRPQPTWGGPLVVIGVLGILLLTVVAPWDPFWRGFAATWCAVAMVLGVSLGEGSVANRVLGWRPAATLGLISYGVYLWHWPIVTLVDRTWVVGPMTRTAVSAGGAVVIAYFSWHVFEEPIIRRGRLVSWRGPRAVAALGGAVALSLVLSVVVVRQLFDRVPVARSASAGSVVVDGTPVPPDLGAGVVEPVNTDGSCTEVEISAATTDCRVTDGAVRVLLLGDSHASGWQHALIPIAQRADWELSVVVAAGCPWQPTLLHLRDESPVCDSIHAAIEGEWFDLLDPEVVIVSGHPLTEAGSKWNLRRASGETPADPFALMEEGTRSGVDTLERNGAHVAIIEPRPSAPFDVRACLETVAMVEECAFVAPGEASSESVWLRQFADARGGVTAIATIDLICPRYPTCDALVGGRMVRFDTDHLWFGFMQDLIPELIERLAAGDATDPEGVTIRAGDL